MGVQYSLFLQKVLKKKAELSSQYAIFEEQNYDKLKEFSNKPFHVQNVQLWISLILLIIIGLFQKKKFVEENGIPMDHTFIKYRNSQRVLLKKT